MELELPKRIYGEGSEPQVKKINNCCKMSLLDLLKEEMEEEYNEVKRDPVFAHIIAIRENGLKYSAKLIHSFLCRQLLTSKRYELWFVFARRPLRFSLQEFNAVTGLNCKETRNCEVKKWVDDGGFWSELLKNHRKISIKTVRAKLIAESREWTHVDRKRLVYLCVMCGLLMAKDEKVWIPEKFIKLLMDLEKLRCYPWGLHTFDYLVESIRKARVKLDKPDNYVLEGFSYALQIWIMEAIPDLGVMLGQKLSEHEVVSHRCSNWKGVAKVSYTEIIQLEKTFGSEGVLYPYISATGNFDVYDSLEFLRTLEKKDERVDHLNSLIRGENAWSDYIWQVEEAATIPAHLSDEDDVEVGHKMADDVDECTTPTTVDRSAPSSSMGLKRHTDHGAQSRKQKLLCQRSAGNSGAVNEELKSFIQGLFTAGFSVLEEKFDKKFDSRIDKLESKIEKLEDVVIASTSARKIGEPSERSIPPSAFEESHIPESQPKEKKDNSQRKAAKKDVSVDKLHEVHLSQSSDMEMEISTQEYLRKRIGQLSQDPIVPDFDPIWPSKEEDPDWLSMKTSCQPISTSTSEKRKHTFGEKLSQPVLDDIEITQTGKKDADNPLVFVDEEAWRKLQDWSQSPKDLQIGPGVFSHSLASRIVGPREWLHNNDMDAYMYLFREKTSLFRWKANRVGFMSCIFTVQIKSTYIQFLADKRKFKLPDLLLGYGKGELPSHGRTNKVWDVDVSRIYVPLCVGTSHWISMCISFVHRTIEVFDCAGMKGYREVEAFSVLIPRIVKAVQVPENKKHLNIAQYSVKYVPMNKYLYKSSCDCGVYALKFIECHVLGLDMSLMNDDNIKEARHKIAVDLWEAANDEVLVYRMSNYVPPKLSEAEVINVE